MKSVFKEYPDIFYAEPHKWDIYEFNVANHIHDKYEISICSSGNIRVDANGACSEISAPCVLLHRPFTVHLVDSDRVVPYVRDNLYFDSDFLMGVDRRIADPDRVFTAAFRGMSLTENQLRRLDGLYEMMLGKGAEHLRLPMLIAMLRELETISPAESFSNEGTLYIGQVIRYIREHFSEPLTSSYIADEFFISRTKLDRDFRFYTQTTIRQFLLNIRFKNTLRLMRGGMSVQSAANASGINDVSNFIRTFKVRYGMTPHRYINRVDIFSDVADISD